MSTETETDWPRDAIQAVAEALYSAYDSEFNADHLSWKDFAGQASKLIEAAAPHIAKRVRVAVAGEARAAATELTGRLPQDAATLRWFAERVERSEA